MNRFFSSHQSGSSLLTIVIIVTLTTILCLNIWRMTVVAHDSALKKQHYEQQLQPLNGIMTWALDVCQNNFDMLYNYGITRKEGVLVEIPYWNINKTLYAVDLIFKNKNITTIAIEAQLFYKKKTVCSLNCCVTKQHKEDSSFYLVHDWGSYDT